MRRRRTRPPSSKHFKWWEFNCPEAGPVPRRYDANLEELEAALEVIREELGNVPGRIVSGWRSPAYNRRGRNPGRAKKSLHLKVKAADSRWRGRSAAVVYHTIRRLMIEGRIPKGGLAAYHVGTKRAFVHYDTRGTMARWKKAPKKPREVA